MTQGTQTVALDSLEGWDGIRGGKEIQEEGDICILMADACRYMAEISTIL